MDFISIYLVNFGFILLMMTLLWIISIRLKNVSIVDGFWGLGFVGSFIVYFFLTGASGFRSYLLMGMVLFWGLRLSVYLAWRNYGKGEDFRYKEFRMKYGVKRYWWISFFQTFLLQGILMWLISAPLLGAIYSKDASEMNWLEIIGIGIWLIGFSFEAGGDWQLSRFKADPNNRGKLLDKGFWRVTRHPNYFGDAAVWWGFGLFSIAAGSYLPALGSLLMTLLIIKVSGVALLEKSLSHNKPEYAEYVRRTSAFIPWFPKN